MWFKGTVRVVLALALSAAVGCTSSDSDDDSARTSPPSTTRAADPTPSSSPSPVEPVSLPALIQREYTGSDLKLGTVVDRNDAYTSYEVTYESNGLTISGLMNIPEGEGPFPALVLAHGYIDPEVYTTGRGFAREQDRLARNGYVVLHTDYRNHAGSDKDPDDNGNLRLGYTEDVIGAAKALKASGRPEIDADRIGLMGRSLGGGVVYNVLAVAPGLFDAAVAFAPVSPRPDENFDQFRLPGQESAGAEVEAEHGTPEENPEFWNGLSPLTYVDRVTEPLLIHHGTEDETCPISWTRNAVDAFEKAGKDVELRTYRGEGHTFYGQWPRSMETTMDFFEENLR
ncbi:alpha/beta hydrolase family protein [Streptomyces blattellae]|uniref:alpha/beta hydrolase family protein n=1 Tax=Streptomyces blattellae TaxID=2569855 RepID=UPI0012B7418E|nr:alpha/beta fold hydrolase [Streptomyces blattellae]